MLHLTRHHSIFQFIVAAALCFTPLTSHAAQSMLMDIQNAFTETWDSKDYELYVPINVWHNRHYYSSEKIDEYNEHPWGLGLGKYRYDMNKNWHGLYAMAFQDSHRDIEPIIGYGYQKMWYPSQNTRIGAGLTAGFTFRRDFDYLPLPILLPIFSIEYKRLALQSTYVPGGNGNGNILFTWLRWQPFP